MLAVNAAHPQVAEAPTATDWQRHPVAPVIPTSRERPRGANAPRPLQSSKHALSPITFAGWFLILAHSHAETRHASEQRVGAPLTPPTLRSLQCAGGSERVVAS